MSQVGKCWCQPAFDNFSFLLSEWEKPHPSAYSECLYLPNQKRCSFKPLSAKRPGEHVRVYKRSTSIIAERIFISSSGHCLLGHFCLNLNQPCSVYKALWRSLMQALCDSIIFQAIFDLNWAPYQLNWMQTVKSPLLFCSVMKFAQSNPQWFICCFF